MSSIAAFLDTKLFSIGSSPVTVATLLTGVCIVAAAYIVSRALQAGLRRALAHKEVAVTGSVSVGVRMLHYVLVAIGVAVALQTAGVELSALFAASAVFAVGIGFAMQNIVQNFVSGIILLVERTIRPGDIIEVDGQVVRVIEMGIRATLAQTRDDETLVIPNTSLVQSSVKSLSLRGARFRVRVTVGVAYSADLKIVRATLVEVADRFETRIQELEPAVVLSQFGASSVDYEVSVWIEDPWAAAQQRSSLREAIWFAFLDRTITIAFPQLDVHFDAGFEETISQLAKVA